MVEQHREILSRIVLQATGSEVISFEPIVGRGMSNKVVAVTTPTARLVVRINKAEHLATFEKEAWCLEQAHARGILVPRVIACGVEEGMAYSIAHYIKNSAVITAEMDHLPIWRTLGGYAATLNRIPIDLSNPSCGAARWFARRWEDTLDEELTLSFDNDYWTANGLLTSPELSKLRRTMESLSEVEYDQGICQIDMCCENALIQDQNYDRIYLLDLELTVAAPVPIYQLACIARTYGLHSEIMNAFRSGYGLSDQEFAEILPRLNRLTVLRMMRQASRARQKGVPRAAQESEKALQMIVELLRGT